MSSPGRTSARDVTVGPSRGFTLVETVVALLLTLLLLSLLAGSVADQQRITRVLTERMEVVEARRVARDLLGWTLAGDALPVLEGGELDVRNFVGAGHRCGPGSWLYRGRRNPDPARDSLWTVGADGRVTLWPMESVDGAECPSAGEEEVALAVRGGWDAGEEPVLFRVFERGRYRVTDAFRYGRGAGGAQPLTAAVLDPRGSRIRMEGDAVILLLQGRTTSGVVERRWPGR